MATLNSTVLKHSKPSFLADDFMTIVDALTLDEKIRRFVHAIFTSVIHVDWSKNRKSRPRGFTNFALIKTKQQKEV
jgi:hypothetical protein